MKTVISKLIGFYVTVLALVAPRLAGRKSFELFCYPFRGKLTERHKEFLYSGETFQLTFGEKVVQAYRWGNGPRNLHFLHGWQSHAFRWKTYVEALDKSQYSIYAIDAPAHGQSPGNFMTIPIYSEAIQQAIKHIGKIDTVICHSIGGFAALYTFHTEPHLVPERMIALAPPGEAKEFFAFYTKQLGLSRRSVQLTVDHFIKVIGKTPDYFSAAAFAASLNIPGLLIHDEADDETSVENSRSIQRVWRNSKLIVTQGKGHNLKSHEVVREVVDFIDEGGSISDKEFATSTLSAG